MLNDWGMDHAACFEYEKSCTERKNKNLSSDNHYDIIFFWPDKLSFT